MYEFRVWASSSEVISPWNKANIKMSSVVNGSSHDDFVAVKGFGGYNN